MEILFITVILGLIFIGVLSFTLFIRRLLINTSQSQNPQIPQPSKNSDQKIEQKLDRIIELLEKSSSNS